MRRGALAVGRRLAVKVVGEVGWRTGRRAGVAPARSRCGDSDGGLGRTRRRGDAVAAQPHALQSGEVVRGRGAERVDSRWPSVEEVVDEVEMT